MTSDELLTKVKEDNVNAKAASTVGGETLNVYVLKFTRFPYPTEAGIDGK